VRLPALQLAVKARLRHPGWWSAAIALAMFPSLFALLSPAPQASARVLLAFLTFIALLNLGVFLCPAPWQWTGDDRPLAGWWRGLLQVLVFALLLGASFAPIGFLAGKQPARHAFRMGAAVGLAIPILLLLGPAGWIIARAERLAQEAREAQARARETQWMGQRGAFSPRLLFSNLNHLATVAGEDTRSAEQGLVDLAALYRRWLIEAELPLVALATDRSLTEQYLQLERSRWGDLLSLRWQIATDLDTFQVPPLFLQPLLEGTLDAKPDDPLVVELHEARLPQGILEVRMRVQGAVPCPGEGLLQPLRRRLQSLLGAQAEARSAEAPGGWEVTLHLPPMKQEPRS